MTTQTDYTPQEWEQLKDLPYLAAAGVVGSSHRGAIKKIKEAFSIISSARNSAKQFPNNELIQSLSSEHNIQHDSKDHESTTLDNNEEITAYALEQCREVISILESKSTPEEATEYKRWIVLSAEHVANAAKSGGFLGLGPKHIDADEARFLQNLKETLGLQE
ncbi:MAG TPA: hypothetical protein VFB12_04085 [Ktedonobacteraceae bacterium]|nr:hypothetical protein [Ktedonobacteraceae bacterium]